MSENELQPIMSPDHLWSELERIPVNKNVYFFGIGNIDGDISSDKDALSTLSQKRYYYDSGFLLRDPYLACEYYANRFERKGFDYSKKNGITPRSDDFFSVQSREKSRLLMYVDAAGSVGKIGQKHSEKIFNEMNVAQYGLIKPFHERREQVLNPNFNNSPFTITDVAFAVEPSETVRDCLKFIYENISQPEFLEGVDLKKTLFDLFGELILVQKKDQNDVLFFLRSVVDNAVLSHMESHDVTEKPMSYHDQEPDFPPQLPPQIELNEFTLDYIDLLKSERSLTQEQIIELLVQTKQRLKDIQMDNYSIKDVFELSARTAEQISLEQHLYFDLLVFERYVAPFEEVPILGNQGMRLLILCHDITKPLVGREQHHEFNKDFLTENIDEICESLDLDLDHDSKQLIVSLSQIDVIGQYFKKERDFDGVVTELRKFFDENSSFDRNELFQLLLCFHSVDAGSYSPSVQKGGLLNSVYNFEPRAAVQVPQNHLLSFFSSLRSELGLKEIDSQSEDEVPAKESESVRGYLEHVVAGEYKGGCLEPERANFLVHTTSSTNAFNIAEQGEIDSVFYLIVNQPEVVLGMQGGKIPYLTSQIEHYLHDPRFSDDEKTKLFGARSELIENVVRYFKLEPLGEDINELRNRADESTNFDQLNLVLEEFFTKMQKNRQTIRNNSTQHVRRQYLAYLPFLDKDIRQQIAQVVNSERFISATLGTAVVAYTPDHKHASTQGAVVVNFNKMRKIADFVKGGNFPDPYQKHIPETIAQQYQNYSHLPIKIATSEYSDNLRELAILTDADEKKGSKVSLEGRTGFVLLPWSVRKKISGDFDRSKIIFFDDTQFPNINVALGWLVSTPYGQNLLREKGIAVDR